MTTNKENVFYYDDIYFDSLDDVYNYIHEKFTQQIPEKPLNKAENE